jgi:hypothetical protein
MPLQAIVEPDIERLDKLHIYFDHFDIEKRYGIDFKEFVRRVDAGTRDAYLANV